MEGKKPTSFPQEQQEQSLKPGIEQQMQMKPEFIRPSYKGSDKLKGKVALITGGDSGIGRSVAVHFAREGADIAISFVKEEQEDGEEVRRLVEKEGRKCLLLPGDLRDKEYCKSIVEQTVKEYGKLNILVNNAAAVNKPVESLEEITDEQLEHVYDVNILSFFRVTRAALKHLKEGDCIINTTSVNAYGGHKELLDYCSTKGAVLGFTRALSGQLAEKKIRVNGVAPGPIWTPFIVSTFSAERNKEHGQDVLMGRAGQPSECGPAYVFLASEDGSYFTGQVIHPNGGIVVNT